MTQCKATSKLPTRTTVTMRRMITTISRMISIKIMKMLMTCAHHQLTWKEKGLRMTSCSLFKVSDRSKLWITMKFMSRMLTVKWVWETSSENSTEITLCIQSWDWPSANGNSYKMILCRSWSFTKEIRSSHTSQSSSWSWWQSSPKMAMLLKVASITSHGQIQRVLTATRSLRCSEDTRRHSYSLRWLQSSWSI